MSTSTALAGLTARYVTLGCKLNFAETASIARLLELQGVTTAEEGAEPDIIVINTCSVTAVADRKCRHTVRSLAARHPQAKIVVTGCYSQLKPDEARALPGVALVVGNDRKMDIPRLMAPLMTDNLTTLEVPPAKTFRTFEHSCSRGDRTRYFLKVQDGCNYFCSYCTIPYARGRSRSPQIAELTALAAVAAARGAKEIVLTGVNIGDFGHGTSHTFLDLITALDNVDGIERYRISSIEPNLLTTEIIDYVASSRRFMPHFHIPLQSGDDTVLRLMRRHYDTQLFAAKIEEVKQKMPHAFIGVDLIVGMRGETHNLFLNSMRLIESLDISRLHVFPYSERPGTAALDIKPAVDPKEKTQRMATALALSRQKEEHFSKAFTGTTRPVLFEKYDTDTLLLTGHTDNYIKVLTRGGNPALINTVANVEIGRCLPDGDESFHSEGFLTT